MTVKTEDKIIKKLNRIEDLLIRVISYEPELNEGDVLAIAREGKKEYAKGETREFDDLITEKYPQLLSSK